MRRSPTLARLDRVFVNTDFTAEYPNTTLLSGYRPTSDHFPLVCTISTKTPQPSLFRFENAWLLNPAFLPQIIPLWSREIRCASSVGAVVARIKSTRQVAKVWARHQKTPPHAYFNCKFLIQMLDYAEEFRILSPGERCLRRCCQDHMALYLRQRAARWKQRGKMRAVAEGDDNTRFFHERASQRMRSNCIRMIEHEGQLFTSHADKMAVLTQFYVELIGRVQPTQWTFSVDNLYTDADRADGDDLIAPFSEKEAKDAAFAMNRNSAPGPDGLGAGFYQAAWQHISPTVMSFLEDFHAGTVVDLERLNRQRSYCCLNRSGQHSLRISGLSPCKIGL